MSAERTAGPATGAVPSSCPYLGRLDDPETHFLQPSHEHRCHATRPPDRVRQEHQVGFCFADFVACPTFLPLAEGGLRAEPVPLAGQVEPQERAAPDARGTDGGLPARAMGYARRLSFEEWTVYLVTAALLVAAAWFLVLRDGGGAASAVPTVEPGIQARAEALAATETPTAPAPPTATARPTRLAALDAAATAEVPTAPAGGLMAALSPSERGVGSFDANGRLGVFGQRELNVGRFETNVYIGGVLLPLTRLPQGSRIEYAALELTGLSDSQLTGPGTWSVTMLDPEAADAWANLTYDTLLEASAQQMPARWMIRADDLVPRRVNVLEFSATARDALTKRLAQGKVAFRITGPVTADGNLFAWDTGYGEGFGTRPVLRVGFVPPPPTPGPRPGEPTVVPLIIWVADPTPAPTPTPLPGQPPDAVSGLVLFLSDRFGDTRLMVLDPAGGRVGQVTQSWTYAVAMARNPAAAGIRVSVAGRPCGSGATPVVDAASGRLVAPGDPARECSVLVVSGPGDDVPREIGPPGVINYEPAVSPDGAWIAYVSTVAGNDEIFKIRVDGTDNTRLTDNVWPWDKHPSWSPDGGRIVFWSNRDGLKQLYVMNADGSGVERLTNNPWNDWNPVWVR